MEAEDDAGAPLPLGRRVSWRPPTTKQTFTGEGWVQERRRGIFLLTTIPLRDGRCHGNGRGGKDGGLNPWMMDPRSENDGSCVIIGDRRLSLPLRGQKMGCMRVPLMAELSLPIPNTPWPGVFFLIFVRPGSCQQVLAESRKLNKQSLLQKRNYVC